MKDRLKEIKHLKYLKSELIKEQKKLLKQYREELIQLQEEENMILGYRNIERCKNKCKQKRK